MRSKQIDQLAKGPNPRARVPVPKEGERCPRHHGGVNLTSPFAHPCLLCRPDLVPTQFGGTLAPQDQSHIQGPFEEGPTR